MGATRPGTVTLSTGHWQLTKPSLHGFPFRSALQNKELPKRCLMPSPHALYLLLVACCLFWPATCNDGMGITSGLSMSPLFCRICAACQTQRAHLLVRPFQGWRLCARCAEPLCCINSRMCAGNSTGDGSNAVCSWQPQARSRQVRLSLPTLVCCRLHHRALTATVLGYAHTLTYSPLSP